jgi:rare lipoprotein A
MQFYKFHQRYIASVHSCPQNHSRDFKNGRREVVLKKVMFFLFFLALSGCSTVPTGGLEDWIGYTESGQASFYADKHQNQKTASGERYRHSLKTASHKNLPFGLNVKVTNIDNGKSVIVKINDRGPFEKGRIIDLSKTAFNSIGNTSSGLINVKIQVVR